MELTPQRNPHEWHKRPPGDKKDSLLPLRLPTAEHATK